MGRLGTGIPGVSAAMLIGGGIDREMEGAGSLLGFRSERLPPPVLEPET